MSRQTEGEKRYTDLSKGRRWFLLILVSMGSSVIYGPIYLKTVFYDPLMQALNCTNEQLGTLLTVYAIVATICYLPAGIIADKVRVRTLSWVGYIGVAALTVVYARMPSYNVLMMVFFGYAIFSILICGGLATSLYASSAARTSIRRRSAFRMESTGLSAWCSA